MPRIRSEFTVTIEYEDGADISESEIDQAVGLITGVDSVKVRHDIEEEIDE